MESSTTSKKKGQLEPIRTSMVGTENFAKSKTDQDDHQKTDQDYINERELKMNENLKKDGTKNFRALE